MSTQTHNLFADSEKKYQPYLIVIVYYQIISQFKMVGFHLAHCMLKPGISIYIVKV